MLRQERFEQEEAQGSAPQPSDGTTFAPAGETEHAQGKDRATEGSEELQSMRKTETWRRWHSSDQEVTMTTNSSGVADEVEGMK